ncbi:hypothetical protein, partial [Chitinophaga tropicalis]|uniref:hypothetical protein n=1 Tax=Chitinophaga tropicalis TaxID=2683588 RepID=UPI001E4E4685
FASCHTSYNTISIIWLTKRRLLSKKMYKKLKPSQITFETASFFCGGYFLRCARLNVLKRNEFAGDNRC